VQLLTKATITQVNLRQRVSDLIDVHNKLAIDNTVEHALANISDRQINNHFLTYGLGLVRIQIIHLDRVHLLLIFGRAVQPTHEKAVLKHMDMFG